MELDTQIEAILFHKAEPVKITNLADILVQEKGVIESALQKLEEKLSGRGIQLVRKEDQVTLSTISDAGEIIEKIIKEELSRDLGKAAIETLAIVCYRGKVGRAEIDYIRGVNSSFILRNLMVRGLIERVNNPTDSRSYLYKPTFELLSHLGISNIEDMPEYKEVQHEIEEFMKITSENEN